jgi:hypothetical protein
VCAKERGREERKRMLSGPQTETNRISNEIYTWPFSLF